MCKVADFGLSREVIDDEYNVQKVSVEIFCGFCDNLIPNPYV